MSVETAEKNNAIVVKALASFGEISTLPEVTARIIEIVNDPDGSARDLHEVIKRDPALAAKVLKVVNSAFYGVPGQIANVDRAIVMLGLSAVRNIAVAASITRMFKGKPNPDLFDAKELWRHSVAVGVAARKITKAMGNVVGGEEMFLAGLIHDLGLLVERQAFPDQTAEVVRAVKNGQGSMLDLEASIIGPTHQDFGDALTEKWKFPRHLRAAVGYHHNPENLSTELKRIGNILYTADTLCCHEEMGFSMTAASQEFTEELLEEMGLSVEDLVQIRDDMGPEIDEAEAILGYGGS